MSLSAIVLLVIGVVLLLSAYGLLWLIRVDSENPDPIFDEDDYTFLKGMVFVLVLVGAVSVVVPIVEYLL